jgi:glutamate-ammonia-ligase adenylyltransferase
VLNAPATRGELDDLLNTLLRAADPEAAPYRFRDGELLRVGLRELFRDISIVEVGQELTHLAEVCLAYALGRGRAEVEERYGGAEGAFAALAVGKLGGREMGYGSDLDLIFAYESSARTESGMSPSEYFALVASRALNRLKEPTRYGLLYHTDVRLRPDGKKGELIVSDRRLDEYYREEAQPWERLALMKVRAVGGDAEFAQRMETMARDAAFDLVLAPENIDHIEDMRCRLAKSASPCDLKRSEGGLAELEFAVRLLQLRHAPQWPELKRGDVLGALDLLVGRDALSGWDHDALQKAYLLFRRVENRIRMRTGRSSSEIPDDEAARADLGRRLGIEGDLLAVIDGHRAAVHAIYQNTLREILR